MLTLLLVCAFSPKVQKYLLGSLITALLRYIAKRHNVSAKTNTLHNASVCKQPPNANLWLGSCPLERTRLIAERASLLAKWSVFAQQPRFRANALHLTLCVRLLAMSAAFDCRKCKCLLLSSLAVSALYRGPRGILCTRGEKEYASIRQPTAACDNRLVKNEAYDGSSRKFICAEDVDGQKNNAIVRLRYFGGR